MNITNLSTKYLVRRLSEKDIDSIVKLCHSNPMFYRYCPPMVSKESIAKDMVALPPRTQSKDKYYLGIFDKEKLIAVLDLILNYPNQDTAFIGFFMVLAECQNVGLGTRLITDIADCLSKSGYRYIRLGYVKGNPQSKTFWLKNGFIETGIETNTPDYTIVVMQRDINRLSVEPFSGTKLINLESLGLSQIYLSATKIAVVSKWFNPQQMNRFQPLPVHDFGNGIYTLTDGHTRAYVAYKNGITVLPVYYDNDDIITSPLGVKVYQSCINWCQRFSLFHIKHLEKRILNDVDYQALWIERCQRNENLISQVSEIQIMQFQQKASELYLYGASKDLSKLYFENKHGDLYILENQILQQEEL